MRCRSWLGGLAVMALSLAVCFAQDSNPLTKEEQEQGFAPLFNGKDLAGWVVMDKVTENWVVENGILKCLGGQGGWWLRSEKEYTDFELRLDFKNTPHTNSGVFLRATEKGNPAFTGMEIQIIDDVGAKPVKSSTGSVYAALAPAVVATKPPGEWNSYDITLKGMQLKVVLNGQSLYDVDLSDPKLNEEVAKSDKEAFDKAVAKAKNEGKKPPEKPGDTQLIHRAKTGYIGLQNHGHPVEFRNIRIRPLQ